ncbi:MAG: hypothetical protein WB471_13600 [Nocardioides sp.]
MRTPTTVRSLGRLLLAAMLLVAGVAHFAAADEFLGQVPTFLPAREAIVIVSGVLELGLGASLLVLRGRGLALLGWVVALFFIAVFPGNVWQAINDSDSFGLDTDRARLLRLPFQPLLVLLALWSTDAWRTWRSDPVEAS